MGLAVGRYRDGCATGEADTLLALVHGGIRAVLTGQRHRVRDGSTIIVNELSTAADPNTVQRLIAVHEQRRAAVTSQVGDPDTATTPIN